MVEHAHRDIVGIGHHPALSIRPRGVHSVGIAAGCTGHRGLEGDNDDLTGVHHPCAGHVVPDQPLADDAIGLVRHTVHPGLIGVAEAGLQGVGDLHRIEDDVAGVGQSQSIGDGSRRGHLSGTDSLVNFESRISAHDDILVIPVVQVSIVGHVVAVVGGHGIAQLVHGINGTGIVGMGAGDDRAGDADLEGEGDNLSHRSAAGQSAGDVPGQLRAGRIGDTHRVTDSEAIEPTAAGDVLKAR